MAEFNPDIQSGVDQSSNLEEDVVFIEPFYGGSHKDFIDLLHREFRGQLYTLPPSKWNWRMRMSALYFADTIPRDHKYRTLFSSSVINLSELVALRPDLGRLRKILYFHENQLVYPVRKQQDRDFQHGYTQILSSLVADIIVFNSEFNMESFLSSIQSFMKIVPDFRPKNLRDRIEPKCSVLYIPILMMSDGKKVCDADDATIEEYRSRSVNDDIDQNLKPLHILWPHRWEHDKNPAMFCFILTKLIEHQLNFSVSILGSHTSDIPDCLQKIFPMLGKKLVHKGHIPYGQYRKVLNTADIVVSTAEHEFFGVAMLEAVFCGCYPLCPNKLVYPEIYPRECLYNTEEQLFKKIKDFCTKPSSAREARIGEMISLERFSWTTLKKQYENCIFGYVSN